MASSLFAQFATNRKAEVEGTWVTFDNSAMFKLARMGRTNKRYMRLIDAALKQHKVAIKNDNLAPEIDEQITQDAFLKTVLVDWKGVAVPEVFGTDDAVPYNYDNGKKLIEALPELYAALKEQATGMANFRAQEIEDDTKALSQSSSSSLTGEAEPSLIEALPE